MVVFPEMIVLWLVMSSPTQRIWIDAPLAAYDRSRPVRRAGVLMEDFPGKRSREASWSHMSVSLPRLHPGPR
jgi:hypothetical protein